MSAGAWRIQVDGRRPQLALLQPLRAQCCLSVNIDANPTHSLRAAVTGFRLGCRLSLDLTKTRRNLPI